MPRWDDPSIIGQPDQTPDPPPPTWSGWRPETTVRVGGQATSAGLAASARRHPAFAGLTLEQQRVAVDILLRDRNNPGSAHTVSDLRRRFHGDFGR
jgi:hypothetical protein